MGKMSSYRAENVEINREAFYGALSFVSVGEIKKSYFLICP